MSTFRSCLFFFLANWFFSILFPLISLSFAVSSKHTFIAGNEKNTCLDQRSIWHTGCSDRSFNVKLYLQMENITHVIAAAHSHNWHSINLTCEENKWNFHIGQTNSLCVPTFMYTTQSAEIDKIIMHSTTALFGMCVLCQQGKLIERIWKTHIETNELFATSSKCSGFNCTFA